MKDEEDSRPGTSSLRRWSASIIVSASVIVSVETVVLFFTAENVMIGVLFLLAGLGCVLVFVSMLGRQNKK